MSVPDVLGYVLDEALSEIREKGFVIDSITATKPVKATEPMGLPRVVRLTVTGERRLEVVVAYQDCVKGGVQ